MYETNKKIQITWGMFYDGECQTESVRATAASMAQPYNFPKCSSTNSRLFLVVSGVSTYDLYIYYALSLSSELSSWGPLIRDL